MSFDDCANFFSKGKVVGKPSFPFSSVSRGGVEVFKAWD